MRFPKQRQLPLASSNRDLGFDTTLAYEMQYRVTNRTALMVGLGDSSGRTVIRIPPKETREGTTWWNWHRLLVGDPSVGPLSRHGGDAGFIRNYIGRDYRSSNTQGMMLSIWWFNVRRHHRFSSVSTRWRWRCETVGAMPRCSELAVSDRGEAVHVRATVRGR